jgi:Protein of unknown function (DUF4245)
MSHERVWQNGYPAVGAPNGMGDDRCVAADKRGSKTIRDLMLSLVVLGVVVYLIYAFIPHDSKASPVKAETVSYTVELQQARRDAPYEVAGPEGLGSAWHATSVTYSATDRKNVTWHLGFIDPEQQYVAVEQSNGDPADFISSVTLNSHRDGHRTVTAGGVSWNRYTGGRYSALVREQHGVTTVVLGTAPDAQLQQLAGALKASKGPSAA